MNARLLPILVTFSLHPAAQRPAEPDVAIVQPGAGASYERATLELVDVDADGRADLVYAAALDDGRRELRIHHRRAVSGGGGAFSAGPDVTLKIDRRAVAFAIADVDAAPGAEVVMFFPDRTLLCVFADRGEPEYRGLAETPFLWQPAHPGALYSWQAGVVDVDGDGRVDVILPRPDGYGIAVQRRDPDGAAAFRVEAIRVPPLRRIREVDAVARFASRPKDQGRFELRLADDGPRRPGALLRITDRVPSPHFHDVDGDGRRDLLAMRGLDVHVWIQDQDAAFPSDPTLTRTLPERLDALIDPSFRVAAREVDGDRHVDLVVVSSQLQGEQRSFVESFRGRRDADAETASWFRPPAGRPDERLRFPGLVALTRYEDVDGDGREDLVVGRVRTDLLDALTAGDGGRIEARLSVFRSGAAGFVEPAMLVHDAVFAFEDLGAQRYDSVTFLGDVDGDRQRDLLLRNAAAEVTVFRVEADGAERNVGRPLWRRAVHEDARLATADIGGPLLAVLEPTQIVLLTWETPR